MMQVCDRISNRHWSLKARAEELRRAGWSYNAIKAELSVAKSTVSLWCRHIQLTDAQYARLYSRRDSSIKGIKIIQKAFWNKRCEAFKEGVELGNTLQNDPIFIAGLMLYWAEGTKSIKAAVINSDPDIIKLAVKWFHKFFNRPIDSMSCSLNLHSGQNEDETKQYWSEITGIPLKNFGKTFIKPEGSGYKKNILYRGTAQIRQKGEGSYYLLVKVLGCISGFLYNVTGKTPNIEDWMKEFPYA